VATQIFSFFLSLFEVAWMHTSCFCFPLDTSKQIGKIGCVASKDDDFRKIPSKSFGPVKYHQKIQRYLELAFCHIFRRARRQLHLPACVAGSSSPPARASPASVRAEAAVDPSSPARPLSDGDGLIGDGDGGSSLLAIAPAHASSLLN